MKERPIIFSGEMVRAILDGRKKQTRRVIKPQPLSDDLVGFSFFSGKDAIEMRNYPQGQSRIVKCPYGQPGDRLWVRETWAAIWSDAYPVPLEECKIEYRADTNNLYPGDWPEEEAKDNDEAPKWYPSIHMPRWASRINLEITNIKVEKLKEISHEDCIAEGINANLSYRSVMIHKKREWPDSYTAAFADLWDSFNAKNGFGWDENPWVWVIEFRRLG